MNRTLLALIALLLSVSISTSVTAKRLKVYSYPKTISPGQMGFIVFENPDPEKSFTQAKCTAERLISWVQSDIPILRIEQKGKQVWTSLGSYETMGDSCIATFMAPTGMDEGPASLFLVNVRDASIPYAFTVNNAYESRLIRLQGMNITPLSQFKLIGEGFVPTAVLERAREIAIDELEHNVGYSKLDKADQYTRLLKRISNDWARVDQANYLDIKQDGKVWRIYVEQCSITPKGMALDFISPPDIKPGKATLTMVLKNGGKEVSHTEPLEIEVGK
jgi:hypothetical protein